MTPEELTMKSIIEVVPQWYISDYGPNKFILSVNGQSITFFSHRPLTPHLSDLLLYVKSNLLIWVSSLPSFPSLSDVAKIKQNVALKWLQLCNNKINWQKVLAYSEELSFRTYENSPVTVNIVISEGTGLHDLTDKSIQKIIDPLASGQQTYIKVDYDINFLDYEEILWSKINDTTEYKFNPEFLQPIVSILGAGDYSLHLTSKGDVIIISRGGLLASCRKSQWHIYDVATFKNCIHDIIGNYRVSCNLFEIVFDLSYKRHGALLVYDRNHSVISEVVNTDSIITAAHGGTPDLARKILSNSIKSIRMEDSRHENRKKRLFLEIASLDGAVIFDPNQILSFGSMIKTHPSAGSHYGARTTAAQSAYQYGGKAIKISSDGDITLLFKSKDIEDNECDAFLKFM